MSFTPDVTRSFNRRFTKYFLDGRPSGAEKMASTETPKWIGIRVGKVVGSKGNALRIKADTRLNNGDGLGYFDREGRYNGFRVNKVEGEMVYPASPLTVPVGTILYRNRDKRRDDEMAAETARRTVPLTACIRRVDNENIALGLTDDRGVDAEVMAECSEQEARTPQFEARKKQLGRLGDTVYSLQSLDDRLGDNSFVAASLLADLRRRCVAALNETRRAVYKYDYRRPESAEIESYRPDAFDRHDNVANKLAAEFLSDHNIAVAEPAAEVVLPDRTADRRVMTTRYCLRRELGACLKTPQASRLPRELYLRAPGVNYRLDFDCANCRMKVILPAI